MKQPSVGIYTLHYNLFRGLVRHDAQWQHKTDLIKKSIHRFLLSMRINTICHSFERSTVYGGKTSVQKQQVLTGE
jgi:hypothetical protein